jgi:putative oxidoreductase
MVTAQQMEEPMSDIGLLTLRLVAGSLMAGHGAQKLFGAFGGPGLSGVAGWLESMGLKPGHLWAGMAGTGEFGGGLLTALGFLNPLSSILMISAMIVASVKGHSGKPIWSAEGGAELPVTYMAVATTLALTGPGRYSLDRLFGIKVPGWLTALLAVGTVATVAYSVVTQPDEDVTSTASDEQAAA